MRVLMLGRIDLFDGGGGDKIQIENTAKELRKLGAEVDIGTSFDLDLSFYDLIHIFQMDWTAETYLYAKKAKEAKKPLVLSPIHHSVEEVKIFDDSYVFDFRRLTKYLFRNQFNRDTWKNVYRSVFDRRKLKPTLVSLGMGLYLMHKKTLAMTDVVLVQTNLEAEDLKRTYGVKINWKKVPNGVGKQFIRPGKFENRLGIEDYIICVGRVEARKNQLSIIEAVEKLREETKEDLKLVFVGRESGQKHFEYMYYFHRALKKNPWITSIGEIPWEEMPSYYHFAKVCVSASWFETTGLTSLEALFCGTNAVASGERAREFLGGLASYCDPKDIDSIKHAIKEQYYTKRPVVPEEMKKEYTWENAAKKTFEVYKKCLLK